MPMTIVANSLGYMEHEECQVGDMKIINHKRKDF